MANVSYPIPPWISNLPDPVQAYSHGLQIGAQVGESQARQQLAQEQMLRQQQKDMVEAEIEKQTFQLKADEAAKDYAAQAKFSDLIKSGVDPLQAMLQVPAMAAKMGPAVQAMKAGQMTPYQTQEIALRQRELDAKQQGKEYGDVQTIDLGEGIKAAFRPGSPGLHIIQPGRDKTISPTAAASLLQKIPEIDAMSQTTGTTNALAQTLAPDLLDIIKRTTLKKAPAKSGKYKYDPSTGKIVPIQSPTPDAVDESDDEE